MSNVLPTSNVTKLGDRLQTNITLLYHLGQVFWPEIESNWTYYPNGQRAELIQVFLALGLALGRFDLKETLKFTIRVGYQIAVAPL